MLKLTYHLDHFARSYRSCRLMAALLTLSGLSALQEKGENRDDAAIIDQFSPLKSMHTKVIDSISDLFAIQTK